ARLVGVDPDDELFKWNPYAWLAVLSRSVDKNPPDDLGIIALVGWQSKHDLVRLFTLDHPRERTSPNRDLDDGFDIRNVDSIPRTLVPVDLDFEVWLANNMEKTGIRDARNPVQNVDNPLPSALELRQVVAEKLD